MCQKSAALKKIKTQKLQLLNASRKNIFKKTLQKKVFLDKMRPQRFNELWL